MGKIIQELGTDYEKSIILKQIFFRGCNLQLVTFFTPVLSGFEISDDATLMIQNSIFLGFFFQTSFSIWILLRNINENFRIF